ncbi:MAG: hypothetical protein AAFN70_17820, partial [Planctomycetota bacterium]
MNSHADVMDEVTRPHCRESTTGSRPVSFQLSLAHGRKDFLSDSPDRSRTCGMSTCIRTATLVARAWMLLPLCIVMLIAGCNSEINHNYGQLYGRDGSSSINGFGGMRELYRQAGHRVVTTQSLNQRLDRSDTLFWVPKTHSGISRVQTAWFENWLRGGDRTLVYVVPDGGSRLEYFQMASTAAPPEQRLEYRRRLAEVQHNQFRRQIMPSHSHGNDWFVARYLNDPIRDAQADGK